MNELLNSALDRLTADQIVELLDAHLVQPSAISAKVCEYPEVAEWLVNSVECLPECTTASAAFTAFYVQKKKGKPFLNPKATELEKAATAGLPMNCFFTMESVVESISSDVWGSLSPFDKAFILGADYYWQYVQNDRAEYDAMLECLTNGMGYHLILAGLYQHVALVTVPISVGMFPWYISHVDPLMFDTALDVGLAESLYDNVKAAAYMLELAGQDTWSMTELPYSSEEIFNGYLAATLGKLRETTSWIRSIASATKMNVTAVGELAEKYLKSLWGTVKLAHYMQKEGQLVETLGEEFYRSKGVRLAPAAEYLFRQVPCDEETADWLADATLLLRDRIDDPGNIAKFIEVLESTSVDDEKKRSLAVKAAYKLYGFTYKINGLTLLDALPIVDQYLSGKGERFDVAPHSFESLTKACEIFINNPGMQRFDLEPSYKVLEDDTVSYLTSLPQGAVRNLATSSLVKAIRTCLDEEVGSSWIESETWRALGRYIGLAKLLNTDGALTGFQFGPEDPYNIMCLWGYLGELTGAKRMGGLVKEAWGRLTADDFSGLEGAGEFLYKLLLNYGECEVTDALVIAALDQENDTFENLDQHIKDQVNDDSFIDNDMAKILGIRLSTPKYSLATAQKMVELGLTDLTLFDETMLNIMRDQKVRRMPIRLGADHHLSNEWLFPLVLTEDVQDVSLYKPAAELFEHWEATIPELVDTLKSI